MKDNEKDLRLLWELLVSWTLYEKEQPRKRSEELYEQSFICKVLDKRFKSFNIDLFIPDQLILIIEICTNGNPGQSLMIISEILENIPNLKQGHTILVSDFLRVYKNKYPISREYPDVEERLSKRWSDQKKPTTSPLDTDNQCDYPEYWLKFFSK